MFPTADIEDISQVTSISSNIGGSSDAQLSAENREVAKQNNSKELTINMLFKEMVFCIALIITTYGALQNTPTRVGKHPQAMRFFSPHSPVADWYKGQLGQAMSAVNLADISFVMYYAPWDAESQYVRGEFEKAAEILSDRVHFSGVNCWNPGSQCRLQHNKIPSWPILIAYTVNSRGVIYKGPREAHSMVKFLEIIMKPLERISCTEDLVYLLSVCDAVVVGFTPISDSSRHYSMWYYVAMKIREFDIIGEICFAVVTSEELSIELGVESVPSARFMLWNDTKEYRVSERHAWNETSLMTWILENFSQPVARIIPMWKKAFSFEKYVDGNPILMLFTPLNPLYEQLPIYSLMREVAMEYYNCNNNESSQWIKELTKLQQVQRLLYQEKDFTKFCKEHKFKKHVKQKPYKKEVVANNNKYPWSNATQKSAKPGLFNFLAKRSLAISKVMGSSEGEALPSALDWLQECSTKVFPAEKSFYDYYEQCQAYEENLDSDLNMAMSSRNSETTMLPFEGDPLSAESLIQENVKHFCKIHNFARKWGPILLPAKAQNITYIHGLACATNVSLNMIAVDSVDNHHFAESLGIDITKKKNMTAVVILDSKHESQYLFSEEFSANTIRDFIYNFTYKRLKRTQRTRVDGAIHTHYFGSDGLKDQMKANDTVELVELTTKTFRRFVKKPDTVSIVLVCGGVCPGAWARAVVTASRLVSGAGVSVRAARLDARRHDLPWHYTPERHPAALVFYTKRGSEPDSQSYPGAERVSADGLVALALRSLAAPLRLRVRLALCGRAKSRTEKATCLKDLREHLTSVVGRCLRNWRRSEDRQLKDALLKRLQYLHRVEIELSLLQVSDLTKNSSMQSSLLYSLSTLSKYWDINVSFLSKNISTTIQS